MDNQKSKIKREVSVLLPLLPSFLRTQNLNEALPISDFTDKELRIIGKEWTEALIRKANSILKVKI